ncbi:hypothetical protein KDA00_02290 [Candidatus Saccharibacteria bacterium]|nr:hypothetical protein [Candidatus Saccharibacteria bacterium]
MTSSSKTTIFGQLTIVQTIPHSKCHFDIHSSGMEEAGYRTTVVLLYVKYV